MSTQPKKWGRLNLETYEERVNPDATFGWENVTVAQPGIQTGLYFRIDGDGGTGTITNIAETISVVNDQGGGIYATVSTLSSDDGTPLDYYLNISAGEISLARQAFAIGGVQPVFRGVHVVTYDGNDSVSGLGMPFAMWIEGGTGNDSLTGGSVADLIDGGVGDDTITGSGGSDRITAGDGNNTVNAGTGNDTVIAGTGNDNVDGGTGNDNIDVGTGTNTVLGGTGNDTVTAGGGNDTVIAGDGADTIAVGDGNNTVLGGTGNDTVTAGTGNDNIDAGDGADSIDAGTGNNTVVGGTGNDTITAGAGSDNIDAGDDNDTVNAGDGNNTVLGGAGNDTVTAGSGADNVNGGDGNDTITTDGGTDTVTGGAGADSLDAGDGNNDIVNADTDDVALQGGAGSGDTLNLVAGVNPTLALVIDAQTNGFENFNLAPGGNQALVNVTFAPTAAAIAAIGTPGMPNYSSLLGAGDTLDFRNAGVGQNINIGALPFNVTGVQNVNGSKLADVIIGTNVANIIDAGDGDDVVLAGAGDDNVFGGAGNDNLFGEGDNDTMNGGLGNDNVSGGVGNDTLVFDFATPYNPNDINLGLDGVDTLSFRGVGVTPSAANLAAIFTYIAQQNADDKLDWGAGDNNTVQFS